MKKLITAGLALGLISLPVLVQAQPADLDQTQTAVGQWVEVRGKISKAKNEWRAEKALIEQRIALYQSELDSLQKQMDDLVQNQQEGAGKRAELQERRESLERAQAVVEGQLGAFERQLLTLTEYFPVPLQDKISSLLGRVPRDNRAAARISASNRMATIVAILNEVDKFNNEVTVVPEIRDGRQVEVIYLGLGQAFYADIEGKHGGVGVPAKGKWEWTEQPELAPDIAHAVLVAQGKIKPAEYTALPLQVTEINATRN